MMKRVSHTKQLTHDYQIEADNWKEHYKSLQLEMEVLEKNKYTLEQHIKIMAAELEIKKASSNQAGKDKHLLESSFAEQLSKATEEIRGLKALLDEKDVYASELVQTLTKAQEDLWVSTDKVRFLESSLALLQDSYDAALAKKEELKAAIEESWAILSTRHDSLMEVS